MPEVTPQAAQTLRVPITSGANDAEGSSSLSAGGKALDFAQGRQTVALRFTGVRIPAGARITGAVIHLRAVDADAMPVNLRIHGLDADNAPAFGNRLGGAKTSASALWQPRPWTVGMAARTADLRAVVQEVVSRGGWRSGNALTFFVTSDRDAKRSAYAFDKSPAHAPVLNISFTSSGSTPTPTPTPTPQPSTPSGSCLGRGNAPLLRLSGTYPTTVTVRQKSTGVRVDARSARFVGPTGQALFATNLNAGSFCLHGGVLDVSGLADTTDWNTFHNSHGLLFYNTPNAVVENLTTLEVGDGIAFKDNNPNWTFRDSYVRHAGDDGVENDRFNSGTVDDVLIDWAYTGFSCRREGTRTPVPTTFAIKNTLVALRLQDGTYGEYVKGSNTPSVTSHGELFKVTKQSTTGCTLVLQDNVFLLHKYAGYVDPVDDPNVLYDVIDTAACEGHKNTIVFVGNDAYYLRRLQEANPACFNVTTDINVWRAARAKWFDRHPQFEQFRNAEPVGEPL